MNRGHPSSPLRQRVSDTYEFNGEGEKMTTEKMIEGLTILQKYRDKPDGYHCSAEHDVLYVFATDKPLSNEDLARMIELGWTQHNVNYSDGDWEFSAKYYNQDESWVCFV